MSLHRVVVKLVPFYCQNSDLLVLEFHAAFALDMMWPLISEYTVGVGFSYLPRIVSSVGGDIFVLDLPNMAIKIGQLGRLDEYHECNINSTTLVPNLLYPNQIILIGWNFLFHKKLQ